jgi:hypothetical protein
MKIVVTPTAVRKYRRRFNPRLADLEIALKLEDAVLHGPTVGTRPDGARLVAKRGASRWAAVVVEGGGEARVVNVVPRDPAYWDRHIRPHVERTARRLARRAA